MGRYWPLATITVLSLVAIFSLAPLPQDQSYHQFAGEKELFGLVNFWNVISNIPFLLIGLAGIGLCARACEFEARLSWLVFFIAVTLVAFGSIWYHLHPDDMTLVWDRLPMAVGFMALFVALLSEYVDFRAQKTLLLPCVALGVGAVFLWGMSGDLRLYVWVQLFPLLIIVILLLFYKSRYPQKAYIAAALGLYVLAKGLELADHQIYELNGQLFAGHPLKHLVAAAGITLLYKMLKERKRAAGLE